MDKVLWPEPRLSPVAARDWFANRIAAREPASLLRLGDGEFSWMGCRSVAPWYQTSQSLNVWFGRDDHDPALLDETAARLRLAVSRATVVGLPRPSRQRADPFCSNLAELYARYDLTHPGQLFTDCGVHRFWQMLLAYEDLLQGLPFLGIVSSRDIGSRVQATFKIDEVKTYPVPSERKLPGDFESLGAHYPERFNELCATLCVPYRGAVFLVGAGALGKIYADVIFQRGGIALDVGSVLDGWASVPSRSFLRQDPGDFSLESYPKAASLDPAAKLERYRGLLRQVFYGHVPTDEEVEFYRE